MASVFRFCNEFNNKLSGFEISERETYTSIFGHEEVKVNESFKIGEFDYEITDIYISSFGNVRPRPTLDNEEAEMDTHIWIVCKTEDPRFTKECMTEEDKESIKNDLNIEL